MSRRRKLFVVALVALVTAAYALWRAPEWGARLLEHALSGYFHREVRVASIGLRGAPFEIEIEDLVVAGSTADALPFLEVQAARFRPSLAPLRGNRIVFSRVRLDGLRLRINAFPAPPEGPGGDDIPRLGGGVGGAGSRSASRGW